MAIFSPCLSSRRPDLALKLARINARNGDTCLIVDGRNGEFLSAQGFSCETTLQEAINQQRSIEDAVYVKPNAAFAAISLGAHGLDSAIGTLAALSLDYDWVYVLSPDGCTPAHVRLAGASDVSLMAYDTHCDQFMRAYWMIDAIRRRFPRFDPYLLSYGRRSDAAETSQLLTKTICEFLGAPPPYMGHVSNNAVICPLVEAMQTDLQVSLVA